MGRPAARLMDMHLCPMITPPPHVGGPIAGPCCSTVLIAKFPAARLGDMAICMGGTDVIASASQTVEIGGQKAARMSDQTAHGGVIAVGCLTVLIGG
jgi:uncharacterized Zn-binding protein involved in type VI secretion